MRLVVFLLTQALPVGQNIIICFLFHDLAADLFFVIFISTGNQTFAQGSNVLFQLQHSVAGNINDRIRHKNHLPLHTRILYNKTFRK